jgi:hypothetical protein
MCCPDTSREHTLSSRKLSLDVLKYKFSYYKKQTHKIKFSKELWVVKKSQVSDIAFYSSLQTFHNVTIKNFHRQSGGFWGINVFKWHGEVSKPVQFLLCVQFNYHSFTATFMDAMVSYTWQFTTMDRTRLE